jgi:hypothetical protein
MDCMSDCMAIPIDSIRAASAFGSTLRASPVGRWYRRLTVFYALPKVVAFIAGALSNEAIAKLTREQAEELYLPLVALNRELQKVLAQAETQNFIARAALRGWIRSMSASSERIGDIAEALAWSADPDLRNQLDGAVTSIEQREFHLT